jgi:chromosome segregation ATPase
MAMTIETLAEKIDVLTSSNDKLGGLILEQKATLNEHGSILRRLSKDFDDFQDTVAEESKRMQARFYAVDKQFDAIDERFDAVDARFDQLEKRVMNVEELAEDSKGRLIGIEDRITKVEYGLEDVKNTLKPIDLRKLKKRTEKLEKKVFGAIQPA